MDVCVVMVAELPGGAVAPLDEAVAGVVMQTTQRRVELVVVVDELGDAGPVTELVKRYSDPSGPRVVRMMARQGLSLGAARNAAIASSDVPYVAFIDPGQRWMRRTLELELRALSGSREAAAVHVGLRTPTGESITEAQPCVGWCAQPMLAGPTPRLSATLFRRPAIDKAAAAAPHGQPFDPALGDSPAAADELLLRLARVGWFLYVPEPLAVIDPGLEPIDADVIHARARVRLAFAQRFGAELSIPPDAATEAVTRYLLSCIEVDDPQAPRSLLRSLRRIADDLGLADDRFDRLPAAVDRPIALVNPAAGQSDSWWTRMTGAIRRWLK